MRPVRTALSARRDHAAQVRTPYRRARLHRVSKVHRPVSGVRARDDRARHVAVSAPAPVDTSSLSSRTSRTEDCDVLIVGGGPAGLVAAREIAAAGAGLEVMLLERDDAIGAPVRCGEGVGSAGLSEFLDPAGATWISRRIARVVFRAPNGSEVRVAEGDVGFILDRTGFEQAIAAQASAAGADVRTGVEAIGMRRDGDRWLVAVHDARSDVAAPIRARVVIAADGVESAVGRWAGIDTRVRARDMESCAQYVAELDG